MIFKALAITVPIIRSQCRTSRSDQCRSAAEIDNRFFLLTKRNSKEEQTEEKKKKISPEKVTYVSLAPSHSIMVYLCPSVSF